MKLRYNYYTHTNSRIINQTKITTPTPLFYEAYNTQTEKSEYNNKYTTHTNTHIQIHYTFTYQINKIPSINTSKAALNKAICGRTLLLLEAKKDNLASEHLGQRWSSLYLIREEE